jgi:hypothetical protein
MTSALASQQAKRLNASEVAITDFKTLSSLRRRADKRWRAKARRTWHAKMKPNHKLEFGPGRRVKPFVFCRADSMSGKIQSTTDAGSLNTFGRNEIEVAPILWHHFALRI